MEIAGEIVSAQGGPEGSNLKIYSKSKQDQMRVGKATIGVCIHVVFEKPV